MAANTFVWVHGSPAMNLKGAAARGQSSWEGSRCRERELVRGAPRGDLRRPPGVVAAGAGVRTRLGDDRRAGGGPGGGFAGARFGRGRRELGSGWCWQRRPHLPRWASDPVAVRDFEEIHLFHSGAHSAGRVAGFVGRSAAGTARRPLGSQRHPAVKMKMTTASVTTVSDSPAQTRSPVKLSVPHHRPVVRWQQPARFTACGRPQLTRRKIDGRLHHRGATWQCDSVDVESISATGHDPHSTRAPAGRGQISDADLVVTTAAATSSSSRRFRLPATSRPSPRCRKKPVATTTGTSTTSGNEHVWYDLTCCRRPPSGSPTSSVGCSRRTPSASSSRPPRSATGSAPAAQGPDIAAAHGGEPVLVTDPIAHYLIESTELNDHPQSFVRAVEAELTRPRRGRRNPQRDRVRQARLLIYNPQTESVTHVRTAAEQKPPIGNDRNAAGGQTYLQWMDAQISRCRTP